MTIIPERMLVQGIGANGGEFYLYAVWDDKMCDAEGLNCQDPNADMLVRSIRYKNMTTVNKSVKIQDRQTGTWTVYQAPAGTPDTTLNIPAGQRFRVDTNWSWG